MRFQSLRQLRILLQSRRDGQFLGKWVKACCVLHNVLLDKDRTHEKWLVTPENPGAQAVAALSEELGAPLDRAAR